MRGITLALLCVAAVCFSWALYNGFLLCSEGDIESAKKMFCALCATISVICAAYSLGELGEIYILVLGVLAFLAFVVCVYMAFALGSIMCGVFAIGALAGASFIFLAIGGIGR